MSCSNSCSWVELVTTGMFSFVSVDLPLPVELVIAHFADQVNMRFILQLIRGISRIFEKLPKHSMLPPISTSLVLPVTGILSVIFIFHLHDSESVTL